MGAGLRFRKVGGVWAGTIILVAVAGGIRCAVEAIHALWTERPFAAAGSALGTVALVALVATLGREGFAEQKILARLIMPAGLFWLALFGLTLATFRLRQRGLGLGLALLFVAYTALGSVPLGHAMVGALERSVPEPSQDLKFDAVFVLGGGTTLAPGDQPELGAAGDRLRLAAGLWRAGRARRLVASGFSPPPYGLGDLAAHTVSLWSEMGVPTSSTTTLRGVNTSEEMAAYAKLAKDLGWREMGLVSSAWHLPRALALAERHGLEVTALPADHRTGSQPLVPSPLVDPTAGGIRARRDRRLGEHWTLGRALTLPPTLGIVLETRVCRNRTWFRR